MYICMHSYSVQYVHTNIHIMYSYTLQNVCTYIRIHRLYVQYVHTYVCIHTLYSMYEHTYICIHRLYSLYIHTYVFIECAVCTYTYACIHTLYVAKVSQQRILPQGSRDLYDTQRHTKVSTKSRLLQKLKRRIAKLETQ